MRSAGIAIWGAGEDYRKAREEGLFHHIDISLVVDKDPQKGTAPQTLKNREWDFIMICSSRYHDEIYQEILEMGISKDKIISGYYVIMQFHHFKKYDYFAEWAASIELCNKLQVICNWYNREDTVAAVIAIRDALGSPIEVSAFSFSNENITITDLRTNSEQMILDMSQGTSKGTILADSDEMLIKVSCKGYDVPHIFIKIKEEETGWLHRVETEVGSENVKVNFRMFMKRQTTWFPYHEEDYLFLKNFADVKDIMMLDCGANYGQSIYSFLLATKYMRIFSFEAEPQLVQALKIIESYTDRVKIFNIGVGAQKDELTFYYSTNNNIAGSFLKENFILRAPADAEIVEVSVPVDRLDDILPKEMVVHFAKFDIEGLEYDAISGMMQRITRDHPILLIEENVSCDDAIYQLLMEQYEFYYYDYTQNHMVRRNIKNSLNYWAIPRSGTTNQEINRTLMMLTGDLLY